jgi:DNA-binding HxlR family transcriptional regulator
MSRFGTDPHYLARREGPATSIEAAEKIDTNRWEFLVLGAIASFEYKDGCISDQVRAKFPGVSYSTVTARYSALDDKGLIRRNDWDRRKGESRRPQMVMRITQLGRRALFLGEDSCFWAKEPVKN